MRGGGQGDRLPNNLYLVPFAFVQTLIVCYNVNNGQGKGEISSSLLGYSLVSSFRDRL